MAKDALKGQGRRLYLLLNLVFNVFLAGQELMSKHCDGLNQLPLKIIH